MATGRVTFCVCGSFGLHVAAAAAAVRASVSERRTGSGQETSADMCSSEASMSPVGVRGHECLPAIITDFSPAGDTHVL